MDSQYFDAEGRLRKAMRRAATEQAIASALGGIDPSYSGIAAAAAQDGRDYIQQRLAEIKAQVAASSAPAPIPMGAEQFDVSSNANKVITPAQVARTTAAAPVVSDPWDGGVAPVRTPLKLAGPDGLMTGGLAFPEQQGPASMLRGTPEFMTGGMPDPALVGRASILPGVRTAATTGAIPADSTVRMPKPPAPRVGGGGGTPVAGSRFGDMRRQILEARAAGRDWSAFDKPLPMDFGISGVADSAAAKAARFLRNSSMPGAAKTAKGLIRGGGRLLGAAPYLGMAAAPVLGAMSGYEEAGTGGAVIQGTSSAVGGGIGALVGSAILPGPGTLIGGFIGSSLGDVAGGQLTRLGQAGLDARASGDTGPMGAIGAAAEAIGLESEERRAQREFDKMQNSPQMKALREQQETARLRQQNDILQQM